MGSVAAERAAEVLIWRSASLMIIFFRTGPAELEGLLLGFAVLVGLEELELAFVIWCGGGCSEEKQCVEVFFRGACGNLCSVE